jgi:hypothetical protein
MVAFLDQEIVGHIMRTQPKKGALSRETDAGGRTSHLFALLSRHCRPLERAGLDRAESPTEPRTNGKAWKETYVALKRGQY